MSTPLERAAEALEREAEEQGLVFGVWADERKRVWFSLADAALGAAQLPERYDTATELRIANLLTAAMYPTPLGIDGSDAARKVAMQKALEMLGLLP